MEPIDKRIYEDVVGEPFPENVKVKSMLRRKIKYFGIYQRLFSTWPIRRMNYDLLINTHGDVLVVKIRYDRPYIVYMHFPSMELIRFEGVNVKYKIKNPFKYGLKAFVESLFWRAYFEPFRIISRLRFRDSMRHVTYILTNSKFSFNAIMEVISRLNLTRLAEGKVHIVHPPIPRLKQYLNLRRNRDRQDMVLTVGRYTPEKNHELVLKVAKLLPNYKFVIIGAVGGSKIAKYYYNKIVSLKKELKVGNVELLADVPEKVKLEYLSKAKVYFHPMRGEHFGIAPAEALAAGLTPIVHTFSGSWTDICLEGKYGYGWTREDPEEIARLIEKAMESWSPSNMAPQSFIEEFSPEKFSKRMLFFVEKALEEYGIA